MSFLPSIKFPQPGRVYIPKPHMLRLKARLRIRITDRGHRITDYLKKFENLFLNRVGAAIKMYIIRGLKRNANKNIHSAPGQAPLLHKPKNEFIRIAAAYHVDYSRRQVLVGTLYSKAKLWGWKHEHGGVHGVSSRVVKGKIKTLNVPAHYPPRPFIAPQARNWWNTSAASGRRGIIKDIANRMKASK